MNCDEQFIATNPLTQSPTPDRAATVSLRSFTLRFKDEEDVRPAENEYDIGTTQTNFVDEVSMYRSTL